MSGIERVAKKSDLLVGVDLPAAAIGGIAAGFAYLAEMGVDLRLLKHQTDDLHLLGGFFVADRVPARRLGLLIHLTNSLGLALLYAAVHDRLPGPPWRRGVLFANVENLLLYPLAHLERVHPAVQRGELDRYWHPVAFLQSVPRHVAYGAVLGSLYGRLRRAR